MIRFFTDFNELKQASEELGLDIDLHALASLDTLFVDEYKSFLVLNVRDYSENPNNLMILSAKSNLAYSQKQFTTKDYKLFKGVMGQKHGEGTVLCFLLLRDVLVNYSQKFEKLIQEIDAVEVSSEFEKLDSLSRSLRKLIDRVDDFVDLLIKLEDRKIPQVETQYISYDYGILRAKAQHLLDRSRNLMGRINGLRNEMEVKATRELNKRIESLTLIMKKLTAITVLLMIPNIVTSHYGMNFTAPEFQWKDGYLFATALSISLMLIALVYLKKKEWL